MPGIIAGGYNCKAHGTLYTYEATWEDAGPGVRWSARVYYDRRLADASGEFTMPSGDPGDAVREAIHAYIERVSCGQARGSSR